MKNIVSLVVLLLAAGCGTLVVEEGGPATAPPSQLDWVAQADVATLQAAMADGELTSEALVVELLDRIAVIDDDPDGPRLDAVLAVAPDALDEARALDAERAAGSVRGPLHGIPILLKGNIDVAGIETTAGSLALAGNVADDDAFLVARLREAGAVILGTANLSEWANFRSSRSSSGWSSVGRQTKNPHALDRNPCGSSSGSAAAVAAGLTVVAIGTETDGSIVCPAGANGVVGIKPTLGLVSRDGIVPIAHSQDTAGPMGRTVRDAALVLQAIAARDDGDPAAGEFPGAVPDYAAGLDGEGEPRLDGVRVGVWRGHFGAGSDPEVEACTARAIEAFEALGAEVVDPVELELDGVGEAEGTVLYSEFGPDLAAYLEAHGAPNGLRTLADVVAYNEAHADDVMPYFGQERMERALEAAPPGSAEYEKALADSKRISQGAIDAALRDGTLDAIVGPTNGPAWTTDLVNGDHFGVSTSQPAAVSGWPNVTVPMCDVFGLPVGLSIFGAKHSETTLLRIAHAFERATGARRAPGFPPSLELP